MQNLWKWHMFTEHIIKAIKCSTKLWSELWTFQQKTCFNPDSDKQDVEIFFSYNGDNYLPLMFNSTNVQLAGKISKCNKIIGIMQLS